MDEKLIIRSGDRKVGTLTEAADRSIGFSYEDTWRDAWVKGDAHPVSLSLPLSSTQHVMDATAYVAGLLPESVMHRQMLNVEMGLSENASDFEMISRMGRDSAGAFTIIPETEDPDTNQSPSVSWLDENGVAEHLRSLPHRPLLMDEEHGIMLSLAGVNNKAAVVVSRGKIGLPRHGKPSTHIIKTDIAGLPGTTATENFCLRLARAAGLRAPLSRLLRAEDQTFILIDRYDRQRMDDGTVKRIHQEDFCQAMGVMPARKYQRHGGPGWAEGFRMMEHMAEPTGARLRLLGFAAFQFLIGNPDAHAKNYSVVYGNAGRVDLAPIYDLNNAAPFRKHFRRAAPIMAMRIGSKDRSDEVAENDWRDFADECGLRQQVVLTSLRKMADKIQQVLTEVLDTSPTSDEVREAAEDVLVRCREWGSKEVIHELA